MLAAAGLLLRRARAVRPRDEEEELGDDAALELLHSSNPSFAALAEMDMLVDVDMQSAASSSRRSSLLSSPTVLTEYGYGPGAVSLPPRARRTSEAGSAASSPSSSVVRFV